MLQYYLDALAVIIGAVDETASCTMPSRAWSTDFPSNNAWGCKLKFDY